MKPFLVGSSLPIEKASLFAVQDSVSAVFEGDRQVLDAAVHFLSLLR